MRTKQLFFTLSLITFTFSLFAQSPQAINYQAVIRDSLGNIVANRSVNFRLSILDGMAGSTQFSEQQAVTTNQFGLVTLAIGTGSSIIGTFSTVNWAIGNKYLKVEVDVRGGNNFTLSGTQQFLSVPFALYAARAGNSTGGSSQWSDNSVGINYNAGKVGMGTTTPTFPVHIETNGDGFSSSSYDTRSLLYLKNTSANGASNTNIKIGVANTSATTNLTHFSPNYSVLPGYSNCGMLSNFGSGLILKSITEGTQSIRFMTGNSGNGFERMVLDSYGSLGIGTTFPTFPVHIESYGDGYSSSNYDPRSLLYLVNTSSNGAANTNIKIGSTGTTATTNITNFDPNYSVIPGYSNCGMLSNFGSGLIFKSITNTSQSIRFITGNSGNGAERMTVNSIGNVGIGTNLPVAKLQVTNGDVYVDDSTKGIILKSPNGGCWRVTMDNTGNFVRTSITCPQ
jgi:hypothetical protein